MGKTYFHRVITDTNMVLSYTMKLGLIIPKEDKQ